VGNRPGCKMLESLSESLAARRQRLVIANLKAPIATLLQKAGVRAVLQKNDGHLCLDLTEAVALFAEPWADWSAAADKVTSLVETRGLLEKPRGCALSPKPSLVGKATTPSAARKRELRQCEDQD